MLNFLVLLAVVAQVYSKSLGEASAPSFGPRSRWLVEPCLKARKLFQDAVSVERENGVRDDPDPSFSVQSTVSFDGPGQRPLIYAVLKMEGLNDRLEVLVQAFSTKQEVPIGQWSVPTLPADSSDVFSDSALILSCNNDQDTILHRHVSHTGPLPVIMAFMWIPPIDWQSDTFFRALVSGSNSLVQKTSAVFSPHRRSVRESGGCSDSSECLNNGTCEVNTCLCIGSSTGPFCEYPDICTSWGDPCQNGGTCIDTKCFCTPEWTGSSCENAIDMKTEHDSTVKTTTDKAPTTLKTDQPNNIVTTTDKPATTTISEGLTTEYSTLDSVTTAPHTTTKFITTDRSTTEFVTSKFTTQYSTTTDKSTTELTTTDKSTTEFVTSKFTTQYSTTTDKSTTELTTTDKSTTEFVTSKSTTQYSTTDKSTTELTTTDQQSTTELATTDRSTTELATTKQPTTTAEPVTTTEFVTTKKTTSSTIKDMSKMSTASLSPSTTTNETTITTTAGTSSIFSTTVIIGIAVGGAAFIFLLLIILIVVFKVCCKRRRRENKKLKNTFWINSTQNQREGGSHGNLKGFLEAGGSGGAKLEGFIPMEMVSSDPADLNLNVFEDQKPSQKEDRLSHQLFGGDPANGFGLEDNLQSSKNDDDEDLKPEVDQHKVQQHLTAEEEPFLQVGSTSTFKSSGSKKGPALAARQAGLLDIMTGDMTGDTSESENSSSF